MQDILSGEIILNYVDTGCAKNLYSNAFARKLIHTIEV